ncbi:Nicotinamide/nicotinic acid mononucleotide adenylyltransferase 1 [Rhodotorula toruloides]|uniref:Nicotinamide-nucleotide adenylyltransferase n=1 Tax=Rhodotorula toruloides TaxID=5286 RepID=A0A0K3CKY6_RHOTO
MDGPYTFPTHRLARLEGANADKTPLVLVACGSYSPVTFLHLRLFEMARDDAHFNTSFHVVGGYLSPVNDKYNKLGLASAKHRVAMCDQAVSDTSDWLMVDPWEARQPRYLPTAQVLDHFDHELNTVRGGADVVVRDPRTGETRVEKRRVRVMLLAGSDLILTMSEPGVWAEKDLHHILGIYGCYIIERSESELDQSIFSSSSVHSRSPLALYRHNIHMVEQTVRNDVSSTKVRLFIRKGMSVKYLIPSVVIRYINRHGLYRTADRRRSSLAQVAPTASPSLVPTLRESGALADDSAVVFEDDEGDEAEKEREKERRVERERREGASLSPAHADQAQQEQAGGDVEMIASTSAS